MQSRHEAREAVRALGDVDFDVDIGDNVTVRLTSGEEFAVMLGDHPIARSPNPDEAAAIAFRAAHDPLKTVIRRLEHEQGVNARLRDQIDEAGRASEERASDMNRELNREVHDKIGIAVLLMLAVPIATALLTRVHVALAVVVWLAVPAAFMYAVRRYGRS